MPARDIYHDNVKHALQKERVLHLAIPEEVYYDLFEEPIGQLLIATRHVRLVVFDPEREVICQWKP